MLLTNSLPNTSPLNSIGSNRPGVQDRSVSITAYAPVSIRICISIYRRLGGHIDPRPSVWTCTAPRPPSFNLPAGDGAGAARAGRRPLTPCNDGALPPDVLYEILLRVPAKALCRLRLVCRSWRSLTSDPCFAGAHSSRHPLIAGLRRGRGDDKGDIHIVDVHSGTTCRRLCCGFTTLGVDFSTEADLVCVSFMEGSYQQALILDPTTTAATNVSPEGAMGFSLWILGHVPSTEEYKVLRIGALMAETAPPRGGD